MNAREQNDGSWKGKESGLFSRINTNLIYIFFESPSRWFLDLLHHDTDRPPSTSNAAPVKYVASSEARNATIFATSSGWHCHCQYWSPLRDELTILPSGIPPIAFCRPSGVSRPPSTRGNLSHQHNIALDLEPHIAVSAKTGRMQLYRIPSAAYSAARPFVACIVNYLSSFN